MIQKATIHSTQENDSELSLNKTFINFSIILTYTELENAPLNQI